MSIVEIARASMSPRSVDEVAQPLGRGRLVAEVEALEPGGTLLVSARDGVEVLLHRGGEAVVDEPGEVLLHEPGHGERQPARDERRAAVGDVAAVLDRADRRGVGRGAADAALLHRLDQGGLGVARRRGGLVAERLGAHGAHGGALAQARQATLLLGLVLAA